MPRSLPLKMQLRELLDQEHFDQIAELAVQKKRVLGSLVAATYDPDPRLAWRAVEAMGVAATRLASVNSPYVVNHLRRLYWLLSEESGGVCYRAPEAMAEILRHDPELFADYIPIVVGLLLNMADEDLDHFRPGILWAIGRLGPIVGDQLDDVLPAMTAALQDAHPQARGMAVWSLARQGRLELVTARAELLEDQGPVEFYEDRQVTQTSVAQLTARVLAEPTLR